MLTITVTVTVVVSACKMNFFPIDLAQFLNDINIIDINFNIFKTSFTFSTTMSLCYAL